MTSLTPGFEEKMDHKPLVSVITPFYNTSPEFLDEAVRNGPGTNLIARDYAERYPASDGILSQFEKMLSAGIMP